jgi:4'-phosphopantetheinyl transferase EntD
MKTATMEGLFSTRVVTACGMPEALPSDLHPVELDSIERAVEKRRLEFAAGRVLARRALETFGLGQAAIPVGAKREPVWPEGIVGSISHTKGFCGVAVARASEVRGLGFDVERVPDVKLSLASHIATDDERDGVQRALGRSPAEALALLFSAKEAFFKFQYPISRTWLGLLDARVTAQGRSLALAPGVALPGVCAAGDATPCRFVFCGDFVMCAIEVPIQPENRRLPSSST